MMMYRADAENNRQEYETSKTAEGNLIASRTTFAIRAANELRGCCNDGGVRRKKRRIDPPAAWISGRE